MALFTAPLRNILTHLFEASFYFLGRFRKNVGHFQNYLQRFLKKLPRFLRNLPRFFLSHSELLFLSNDKQLTLSHLPFPTL